MTIRYVKLDGKTIFIDSVQGIKFKLFGTGNLVTIYEGTEFNNCLMNLKSNVSVTIGKSRHNITGLKIWGANSRVAIGQDFSCWGVEIRCHEPKSEVIIGDDCMFSEEILVYPTDVHAIYDNNTKEVLNKSEPIIIGNHVWCGRRVSILKGSQISDNSVIGMGSVVVNKFNTSNLVIAGCPARLIKSNINWDRKNSFDYRG
ncbi:acetyltransferase [Pasteurellaceae bacterium 15-036681]|nr:acetyltransferase [Pasteurellaceae bacterium 15-036681]